MIMKRISLIGLLLLANSMVLFGQKYIGTYVNPARIITAQEKVVAGSLGLKRPELSWVGTATKIPYPKNTTRISYKQDFDIEKTILNIPKNADFTIKEESNIDPESDSRIFRICLDKSYVLRNPETWGPAHYGEVEDKGTQWCYKLTYKIIYADE